MSEGWAAPLRARKWHYFVEGRSLCRKWLYLGNCESDDKASRSDVDCVVCVKKLDRRQAEETPEGAGG